MLLQLEKNPEILPSTRDETVFCCGVWREIPASLLSLERVLDILEATLEDPRLSRLHLNRTPRVPPQIKKIPGFPPHPERRVHFPASLGKDSRFSLGTSRGGELNLTLERNSRVGATISKDPMSQCTPQTPDSPTLT